MPDTSEDYIQISLESLSLDSVFGFDLYKVGSGSYQLYRHQSVAITREDIDSLIDFGQDRLFVPVSQKGELMAYLRGNLPALLRDQSIPVTTKLDILLEASVNVLTDALDNPESAKLHQAVVTQSGNNATLAKNSEEAQRSMVNSEVKAPLPVSHAIKVSNLSILLGMRCSINDHDKLRELGTGAALHEIGKSIIDSKYYIRDGGKARVTNERLIKYPEIGVNMLSKAGAVSSGALKPIREHQERLDGSGFPLHLRGSQISVAGRIVAICDHFDECVNGGDGQEKQNAFNVLRQMKKSSGKFDRDILRQFILLLAGDFGSELYTA